MPASDDPRGRRDTWLLFAAFCALYLATAARTVQGGDSGEFLTVAASGGVAHPPGYPIFVLWSALWTKLPLGTVAWRVAAASGVLGALTLATVHRAVWIGTGHRIAAGIAAGALGLSPLFWRWSVVPEVLSGAALTAGLLCLVGVRIAKGWVGPWASVALGLAFATGVANHHTAILLLPLLAWAAFAAVPRPWTARSLALGLGTAFAASLVGLLPYLLLVAPGGAWRWGDTRSFGGLLHHFLRSDYGTLSTGQAARGLPIATQPLLYLRGLLTQFPGALWLLGFGGFAAAWRFRRGFALALAASWAVAGLVFVTQFDLPPEGYYRVVVERFHPVPNTPFAVALGFGAAWLLRHPFWSAPRLPALLLAGHLVLAGSVSALTAPMATNTILHDFLHNTLQAVEPDALIVTSGDSMFFGCLAAQEVLGLRPDVTCLGPNMLPYPWYRAWLLERHPKLVLTEGGQPLPAPEVVTANAALRPVYLSVRLPLVRPEFVGLIPPTYPAAGTLLRVLRPGQPLPPPPQVEAELLDVWQGFEVRSRITDISQLGTELEWTAWDHYGLVWNTLASGFSAQGDEAGKARCEERVRALSPWILGIE